MSKNQEILKVEENKKYILAEVVTPTTPKEYATIGRNRAPGSASIQKKSIPFDTERNMHDLGLNIRSKEFIGKSKGEVAEILLNRRHIVDAFKYTLNIDVDSLDDNSDVLNAYRIETFHGKVFDTTDHKSLVDIWCLLYSKKASYTKDLSNTFSEYEVTEDGAINDIESNFIETSAEANALFLKMTKENKEQAVNILYLLNEQRINKETKDSVLITMFKRHSESREMDVYNGTKDYKYNIALKVVKEDSDTIKLKYSVISNLKNFEKTKEGYFFRDKNIGMTIEELEKYFAYNEEARAHLYSIKQK